MKPMGAHLLDRQRHATLEQLVNIREALIGYAATRHRLPCPISSTQTANTICTTDSGFVPAFELGINGNYNRDGILVDSFGQPILYHVSLSDSNNNGLPDFTSEDELREVGIQNLSPQFEVCNVSACDQLRANRLPVILVSTGASNDSSADETENLDGDDRFVSRDLDTVGLDRFDDIVVWLSGSILYTNLLRAHVLP